MTVSSTPEEQERVEEILYRFPYSHVAVELLPDHREAFRVRLCWLRGKASRGIFESTAFRPLAEVTLRGQTFPVYLNQHSRKKRQRIVLGGRRKTSTAARAALRFLVYIEGREDTLLWTWRVGATASALAAPLQKELPDSVQLSFPFPPGHPRIFLLTLGTGVQALAVWSHELVTTLVSQTAGLSPTATEAGIDLVQVAAELGGAGVTLAWETRSAVARREAEVYQALRQHAAQVADAQQLLPATTTPFLGALSAAAATTLMREDTVRKHGVDRLVYTLPDGRATVGEGADTALAACALLGRHYLTGDDALRRRARLLGRGVCDFQVAQVDSPHWGALWDAQRAKRFEDLAGERTLSIATAARAATGLHVLHAHFQTELLARAALAAAQWLLLRMDRDGFLQGERFLETGAALLESSPWAVGEALTPLVETFRRTNNETFLRAALRTVGTLEERFNQGKLLPDQATTEHLAALIEGVLLVSREYESTRMIALATELGTLLRTRRLPDGALGDPLQPEAPLRSTLAGVRGALALARVDQDPLWLLLALRALRSANTQAHGQLNALSIAELGQLTQLPLALLLAVGALGKNCVADREKLAVVRQWQTFAPEPAAWEYIQVHTPEGAPVDFLPLVCPATLQVLIPVIAGPEVTHVRVIKNNREPMVRNLLTGDLDMKAELIPLGAGTEARIGVFLADT